MSVSEVAISELGRIVTGKTPMTENPAFFEGEYQFVTPSDLDWRTYYCRRTERTVTEQAKSSHQNQFVPPDAVMVTCIGNTIGKCGISSGECLTNQQINTIIPKAGISPRFVYYLLINNTELIRGIGLGGGAATPILNKTDFSKIKLRVPQKRSWDGVASILSTYDDLIENNQRRMELLEEAARQLYIEWFIRLRFPGHEHTRITNGVPEEWDLGTIADFFDTTSGGTPSRANPDFYTGDINWVKTQELNDDFIFETDERITEDALASSSAKLFPAGTLLVSIYGGTNIGRTGILAEPAATNQACCALFPKDPRAHFIYGALYFREQREHLIALAQGAAQTNISQQVIRALPMQVGTTSLMSAFVESLSPAFEQMKNLKRQNEKLRAARDLLLPRLMNEALPV